MTPPIFLECRPHRWRLRHVGRGTRTLLLHGAGSSLESFDDLATGLSQDHELLIPDLPGHGQTRLGTRQRSGLSSMAEDIWKLASSHFGPPDIIVGHSAGGAIALEIARRHKLRAVIAINPALKPFDGLAGWLFPFLAKSLALNPLAPLLLARLTGRPERIRDLLMAQGSAISDDMVARYSDLAANRHHISGTLAMMGQWNVEPLRRVLPQIATPTLFLTGSNDHTVDPATSLKAAEQMRNAQHVSLQNLGHLAHEEAPEQIANTIKDWERKNALLLA